MTLRTVPPALQARLDAEVLTVCRIWRVMRTDGLVACFTDHVRDLEVGGRLYQAINAVDGSAIDGNAELAPASAEADIVAAAIAERDVEARRWSLADVQVELVDYTAPELGVVILARGELGEVRCSGGRVAIELRGFKHRLSKPLGAAVTQTCTADLGDARCGVALGPFTVSGSVTGVTDAQQFADSARAEVAGHFDGGVLTFTTGANAGASMEIKRFGAGGALLMFLPFAYPVAVGDAYSLVPGCAKTIADCSGKYGNVVNFRGFPFVPGAQALRNGGTA